MSKAEATLPALGFIGRGAMGSCTNGSTTPIFLSEGDTNGRQEKEGCHDSN